MIQDARSQMPKKPYRRPKLLVYGDIREVTGAFLTMIGAADGKVGDQMKILKTGG